MSYKKLGIIILTISFSLLFIIGGLTVVYDPFFHYHKPFEWQTYFLYNQRYQNDGIARNFDYNAIIIGTSMTENFSASEFDNLFGEKCIKIPYYGSTFKEINNALCRATERNPNIQTVIRSLDHYRFLDDKDNMTYDSYPDYLYDDNPFNDVSYLLNKDVFFQDVYPIAVASLKKTPSTTFDEYSNWNDDYSYGKDVVLESYTRLPKSDVVNTFTEQNRKTVEENVFQNIISLVKANPQIDFYLFLPAYSIVYWDELYTKGDLELNLQAQQTAIEMMLEYENIHLYSFLTDYETVCELNNYKDTVHYHEGINSKILKHMSLGEYKVTKDNCNDYFSEVYEFYTTYPYDSIFE